MYSSCKLILLYFITIYCVRGFTEPNPDEELSYCFQFTWKGPEYDEINNYNGTCEDYLTETSATGVPCRNPLMVTRNGSAPDLDDLYLNSFNNVTCRRTEGQVCARYTYTYNNDVENVTYMCTKVYDVDAGVPVTRGCYTQSQDAYDIELCVCQSSPGPYKPCNNGILHSIHAGLIVAIILFIYLINYP